MTSRLIKLADGTRIYATKSGKLATGRFVTLKNGKKIYVDANSKVVYGLFEVDGRKYYANKFGRIKTSTWVMIDGVMYFCDKRGVITKTATVTGVHSLTK